VAYGPGRWRRVRSLPTALDADRKLASILNEACNQDARHWQVHYYWRKRNKPEVLWNGRDRDTTSRCGRGPFGPAIGPYRSCPTSAGAWARCIAAR